MSQVPERNEKDCLNCGTLVQGRFCHICGQENIVLKSSLGGLILHFFEDITHFHGSFFSTINTLIRRPGHVPKLFIEGKRQRFLNPIRMYLFTSAAFFLIFFSFNNFKPEITTSRRYATGKERIATAKVLEKRLIGNPNDTTTIKLIERLKDTTTKMSYQAYEKEFLQKNRVILWGYSTKREYDSAQRLLPAEKKDNWIERTGTRRVYDVYDRYEGDWNKAAKDFFDLFLHKMPLLFFISMPFFALLLKLLYVRRKQFFYTDHFIFILYHYVFSFLLFFLIFCMLKLQDWLNWGIFSWLIAGLVIWWSIYFYKGLRVFYQQGRGKTILKFLILNIAGYILVIVLFFGFFIFSAFKF